MSFDELCKDFQHRCPKCTPVGSHYWFSANWNRETDSINDLLIRWLKEWNIPYLRDYDGTIWFLYDNNWTACEQEVRPDNTVVFNILVFVA